MKEIKLPVRYLPIIICFLSLISCRDEQSAYKFVITDQQISKEQIKLDTVLVFPRTFSGVGFWAFSDTNLLFFDNIFHTALSFDEAGNQSAMHLGRGDGPDQVASLHDYAFSGELGNIILSDHTFGVYDHNWQIKKKEPIDWNAANIPFKVLEEQPRPDHTGIYEINWRGTGNGGMINVFNDQIVVSVTTSHPKLNAYMHESFYTQAAILAAIDINTGHITKLGGRRGDAFLEQTFIPNFDFMAYDTYQEEIHVTFGPDPFIYVLNNDLAIVGKYGSAPEGFKNDYFRTTDYATAQERWLQDLEEYGYNDWLYTDQASGRVFRTVKPHGKNGKSILQVYSKEKILIGSFEVPERFRVIGLKDGFYYADGLVSETDEQLGYYKFSFQ